MRTIVLAAFLAVSVCGPWIMAQTPETQVSAGEWGLFLPEGEGKTEMLAYCGSCHDHSFLATARMSKDAWVRVSEDMLTRLSKDLAPDAETIGAYLGARFGPTTAKLRIPLSINCAPEAEITAFVAQDEKVGPKIIAERSAGPFLDRANLQQRLAAFEKELGPVMRFLNFTQNCSSATVPPD